MRPSLSIDVVTTVPGDMFTQMRAAFGSERARVNAVCWEANTGVPETMLTARQMLEAATINGAHVAGVEDRTGSLTPGKKADVVLIDASSLNMVPITDPYAAVTLCADVSNVNTVIVDGVVRKQGGKLVADAARARQLVEAAHDRLVTATAQRAAASAEKAAGTAA
jgi:cytosine/adenosine deaminase-related metal-dependent hydrolase